MEHRQEVRYGGEDVGHPRDIRHEKAKHFLQHNLRLSSGAALELAQTAYVTRGELAKDRGNAVLVTHGFTNGPGMITSHTDVIEGGWGAVVGPGRAIDTDRYFVVCANVLGSSYGSTNAASLNPETGHPYGSRFPDVTIADMVRTQRALLHHLGIEHLIAVAGPSFGGAQALQWGISYPDFMDALVPVLTFTTMPNAKVPGMVAELSAIPGWNGGDYYGATDLTQGLADMHVRKLKSFGVEAILSERFPDTQDRETELCRMALRWARGFDANSLLILRKAMSKYDVAGELGRIKAPVFYALSRTDRAFPPHLSVDMMSGFKRAGVDATYFEIDSEHGHFASGTDAARWTPTLRDFLRKVSRL